MHYTESDMYATEEQMTIPTTITESLEQIQRKYGFTDQQLAQHVGVSRWTIHRIKKGNIGETVSTCLVNAILRELPQTVAKHSG